HHGVSLVMAKTRSDLAALGGLPRRSLVLAPTEGNTLRASSQALLAHSEGPCDRHHAAAALRQVGQERLRGSATDPPSGVDAHTVALPLHAGRDDAPPVGRRDEGIER